MAREWSREGGKAKAGGGKGGGDAGCAGTGVADGLQRASLRADLPRLGKGPAMSSSTLAHMDTNDLDAFFMPFTSNRQYKKDPRLVVGAEGMYFRTPDGRQVIDSSAGLWCVNAGHCHPKIVEAEIGRAHV